MHAACARLLTVAVYPFSEIIRERGEPVRYGTYALRHACCIACTEPSKEPCSSIPRSYELKRSEYLDTECRSPGPTQRRTWNNHAGSGPINLVNDISVLYQR